MAGKKSKIGKSVFSILVVLAVLLGAVYAANIANFRVNLHYKTGAVDIQMDVKKDGETVESARFDNLAPASDEHSPSAAAYELVITNVESQDVYYRLFLENETGMAAELDEKVLLLISSGETELYRGPAADLCTTLLGVQKSSKERFLAAGKQDTLTVKAWLAPDTSNRYQGATSGYVLVCEAVQAKNQEDGNVQFD